MPACANDTGAVAQGRTRYERGLFYFPRARAIAARMGAPFAWRMRKVEGVGHEASRMAPAGAAVLAGTGGRNVGVNVLVKADHRGVRRIRWR